MIIPYSLNGDLRSIDKINPLKALQKPTEAMECMGVHSNDHKNPCLGPVHLACVAPERTGEGQEVKIHGQDTKVGDECASRGDLSKQSTPVDPWDL